MRLFIVRQLRRVQRAQVEELIGRGWEIGKQKNLTGNWMKTGDIEAAIDLSYFPKVVHENWQVAFAQHFKDDLTVQSTLWVINKARKSSRTSG